MRQRNGRQKFHDLRLLTFQDWIVPRYRSYNKPTQIMKNSRLPVFSYTKMDNGPPLSPISSQFAWAGHVLPDLVQEQSDRLLRRLERPKTADGRITRFRNNQIKNTINSRPMTAAHTRINNSLPTTFTVDGQKYESRRDREFSHVEMPHDQPSHTQEESRVVLVSPSQEPIDQLISERSNSPDFIANLYKEYEFMIASGNMNDETPINTIRESEIQAPTPAVKLLRKPTPRQHLANKTVNQVTKPLQTSQSIATEKIVHVHCVVKLPSDQNDISTSKTTTQTSIQAKTKKPDTWLDLSEIVHSSDDDERNFIPNGLHVPPQSLASESICSLKLTDIPSDDDVQEIDKKPKFKSTRPCSSKCVKRTHIKSRSKKRRSHSSVEEAKGTRKQQHSRVRNSDKLREEIETQMSKLDFDSTRQNRVTKDISLSKAKPIETIIDLKFPATNSNVPSDRGSSAQGRIVYDSMRGSIPIKKIPIQILSDPFSSKFKIYRSHTTTNNGISGV